MKEKLPVEWLGDKVRILDQTKLPQEEIYLELSDYQDVADAIKTMKVRGAPAIGIIAAYGMALGALKTTATTKDKFLQKLKDVSHTLSSTRPTARNLFQAIEQMEKVAESGKDVAAIKQAMVAEAVKLHEEGIEDDMKLSRLGAWLIKDNSTVLTHCNAGALATSGYGTALGVIKQAVAQCKKIRVINTETRPLLQGARLTCWELKQAGIPNTLITDSMAGYFMKRKEIDCVIVGADRIAANGDTANKIGTYTLAVLAHEHNIPFYVAAPTTTIDVSLPTGDDIPIEERSMAEVTHIQQVCTTPEDCIAANPAFDVTPHNYITAIITEKGIIREPFGEGIKRIFNG